MKLFDQLYSFYRLRIWLISVLSAFMFVLSSGLMAGTIYVVNTSDTGPGSLRQAMLDANANLGLDSIRFDISTPGLHTITLLTALPILTEQVVIDGYSQAGSSVNTVSFANNAVLSIQVNGNASAFIGFRFNTTADNSTIRGLVINNFSGTAIQVDAGCEHVNIHGNFIGVNAAGTAPVGTQNRVLLYGRNTRFGDYNDENRNIISGCVGTDAVLISGPSSFENEIRNNFINVSADGTSSLAAVGTGIRIESGAYSNYIGELACCFNWITGCTTGIAITGATTINNDIRGNKIWGISGLGIDLGDDGITSNDLADGDSGPNNLMNKPLITEARTDLQGRVYVKLDQVGLPGANYRFDVYASPAANASGQGDGFEWIGAAEGVDDGSGSTTFHITAGIWNGHPVGTMVTVTATELSAGGTSEYSNAFAASLGRLTVTNTSEVVNGNTSSVIDLLDSPGADGISLRESVLAVNNTLNAWTPDWVYFDIPGPSPHLISLTSGLPPLIGQTGFSGDSDPDYIDRPVIQIDGSGAGAGSIHGFEVQSEDCYFYCLSLTGFSGSGIYGTKAASFVAGCHIGVLPDGVTAAGNGRYGIELINSESWHIGSIWNHPDVYCDNALGGVRFTGPNAALNIIRHTYLGVDRTGLDNVGNQEFGILIEDGAHENIVGGTTSDEGNVIGGHLESGIEISGVGTDDNRIISNMVGLGLDGSTVLSNADDGISISNGPRRTLIGDGTAAGRNIISGNADHGIELSDCAATRVIGNYIGTDITGVIGLGIQRDGLNIDNGALENYVGDGTPGGGNLIAGNDGNGIRIHDLATNSNEVIGNFIGTDITGNNSLPNGDDGVNIDYSSSNRLQDNVIGGNLDQGIDISYAGADDNVIIGNSIGIGVDGTSDIGNGREGIVIENDANDNIIGEPNAAGRNRIGYNTNGIYLSSVSGTIIQNNCIGLDSAATVACSNTGTGIIVLRSSDSQIGGTGTTTGNIISANGSTGIHIEGVAAVDNTIEGNIIGGDVNASPGFGNSGTGISIIDNATRSRISQNRFNDNARLAIDLQGDFVTSNDNGDADSGANDLFNFPVIENATLITNTLTISGFAPADSDVEFFIADSGPSPVGHSYSESFGEGETYLFSATEGTADDADATLGIYTNDGTGPGVSRTESRFEFTVDASVMGLNGTSRLTMTATSPDGSTSEFGQVFLINAPEICDDGLDNDGDGLTDCEDPDCNGSIECPDNDNDGYTDSVDLDDDNDGILDVDEHIVSVTGYQPPCNPLIMDFTGPVTLVGGTNLQVGAVYKYTAVSAGIDAKVTIMKHLNQSVPTIDDDSTDPTNFKPRSSFVLNGMGDQSYTEFMFEFVTGVGETPVVIPELFINFNDIDGGTSYGEQNWVQLPTSYTEDDPTDLTTVLGDWVLGNSGTTEYSGASNINPQANFSARYINRSSLRIRVGVENRSVDTRTGTRAHNIEFACISNFVNPTTYLMDLDADGKPNFIDLDSDNDGIYDCVESLSGQANTGGVLDGGVDSYGIPLSVSNGAGGVNYTYGDTNSNNVLNAFNSDSDGDGCPDVIEAGFPDGDGDTQLGGVVPPTIDSEGRVTSGGL